MIIREAKKSDLHQWAAMRSDLWPDSRDDHVQELKEYFSSTSIDILQCYLLVDHQNGSVGFLELNIRNFAEGSRSPQIPYIEAWYVSPIYRGKGYGRQLMQRAVTWAREKGFSELASDTNIDNTKSISLHKQLGFTETERIVCFLKNL